MTQDGDEKWLRLGPATVALVLLNTAGFVALTVDGDLADVLGLPAGWSEIAQQPWTLLTVLFTSASVAHLLVAVAVIVLAGGALERRVGSVNVLGVYLLSGLAASLAMATAVSAGVTGTQTSLGASGAFLGLVAALAAMRPSTAALARLSLPKIAVAIAALNVLAPVLGVGDWTSSVAHLSGLAVGAAWGLRARAAERVPATRG
jgi:membrane associated rhomboid family serine protease